jgi:hypothetical protein
MNNLETTFTDISDWHKNEFYSTGGTRSKYIALELVTNDEYFFKGSKETIGGEIRYPTEFWSEIVSSKIGQFLGFPMLDYNIGYDDNHKQKIGCLSKSMIGSKNKLTEGIAYLTGFNPKYNPETDKNKYTFQFIRSALKQFDLIEYVENIIEIIVFDAIIGNSDRHQENWGIILFYKKTNSLIDNQLKDGSIGYRTAWSIKFFNRMLMWFNDIDDDFSKSTLDLSSKFTLHQFAPIYDSGCCLGREHTDEYVLKMLNDSRMIEKYIRKGESEIHWEGHLKKRKHFELIELLLDNYPIETKKFIARVHEKYKPESIKEIIENIDTNVPKHLIYFKLSETRKQLMFKLVTLRIEKLIQYL